MRVIGLVGDDSAPKVGGAIARGHPVSPPPGALTLASRQPMLFGMNRSSKSTTYLVIGALVLAPASYAMDRLCEDMPECDGETPFKLAELLTVGSTSTSGPQLVRNTYIGDDFDPLPVPFVESERRYTGETVPTYLSAG